MIGRYAVILKNLANQFTTTSAKHDLPEFGWTEESFIKRVRICIGILQWQ